jgi:hypothetical protein
VDQLNDGRHDFDFLHGSTKIRNRRLKYRLQGCTEWEEFEATQECSPILGGFGNMDAFHATFPDGSPIEGMSLRIFNPATRDWSIYWSDNRSCELQPPVVGRFTDGQGAFYGDDTFDGQPIRVVFHWTDITPNSAKWEQAFSADGGQTWEPNWQMFFTRDEAF